MPLPIFGRYSAAVKILGIASTSVTSSNRVTSVHTGVSRIGRDSRSSLKKASGSVSIQRRTSGNFCSGAARSGCARYDVVTMLPVGSRQIATLRPPRRTHVAWDSGPASKDLQILHQVEPLFLRQRRQRIAVRGDRGLRAVLVAGVAVPRL